VVSKKTFLFNPLNFLTHWRSLPLYEMTSYVFMFASVPMLAYGIQLYNIDIIRIVIFTVITLYAGFFAALIWNDITDADIDSVAHPDRPIPSGRISKKNFFLIALFFSLLVFIFASLISPICLIIVCVAALFVTFHDKYLKKRIKISAYSEIFTPLQWIVVAIFGFFAIWTALPQSTDIIVNIPYFGSISTDLDTIQQLLLLIVFVYFVDNAHDLAEGIVDVEGDRIHGVKTYATSYGVKNAARISFLWFLIAGLTGIILFFITVLSLLFLVLFICIWIYIMYNSYKLLLLKKEDMEKIGVIVGRRGFDFFLFSFNFMFLDLSVQLIIHYL
jgi:4-hydroxybenzoate polyprenyltransferase